MLLVVWVHAGRTRRDAGCRARRWRGTCRGRTRHRAWGRLRAEGDPDASGSRRHGGGKPHRGQLPIASGRVQLSARWLKRAISSAIGDRRAVNWVTAISVLSIVAVGVLIESAQRGVEMQDWPPRLPCHLTGMWIDRPKSPQVPGHGRRRVAGSATEVTVGLRQRR